MQNSRLQPGFVLRNIVASCILRAGLEHVHKIAEAGDAGTIGGALSHEKSLPMQQGLAVTELRAILRWSTGWLSGRMLQAMQ